MSTTDTQDRSYVVRHPLVKGGKPIVFDTAAEAEKAESLMNAHANFAAWLFQGGIPRKENQK